MDGGNRQAEGDFVDNLPPGYCFCPTDSELIVHYLKPKIKTGIKHTNCRLYEVNLYNDGPDELSSQPQYRDCDGKWYFLTPLERKYPKGDRPNRRTKGKNGGFWKASQKFTTVYDDMDRQQVVGTKRSLAYHDKNSRKTEWLMYEYTTDRPNLHIGTNMLTTWVLCKIYKKEKKTDDNNQAEQVPNSSNQADKNGEQNQPLDAAEPSPRRRKVSKVAQSSSVSPTGQKMLNATNSFRSSDGTSSSTPTEPLAIAAPPTDNMMATCPYPVTSTNFPNWDIAAVNLTDHTMLDAINSFRSSDGASSSTLAKPLAIAVVPPQAPTDNMMATCQYPVTSTNFPYWDIASVNSTDQTRLNATNSFRSSNGALSSTLAEPLPIAAVPPQPPTDKMMVPMCTYPVNSTNFPYWDIASVNSTCQTMLNATNIFQSSNGASSCTPTDPLPIAAVPPQPPTDNIMPPMCPYPVTSTNFPNWDVADNCIPQLDAINATGSLFDEGLMSFDHAKDHWFSLEEMFGPNWQQNYHP